MSVHYSNETELQADRDLLQAMWRGFMLRCPNCGKGKLFSSYLKTVEACDTCGEEIHHHRADDAPPYFTIFIVGHILVPMILWIEMAYFPPMWVHMVLWLPLTVIMALAFLPPVKGALVGLQWALRMHGFSGESEEATG